MYKVIKRMEIAGSHRLDLDYESKCQNLHGHNWIVKVGVKSECVDRNGMVLDFTHIKKNIHDKLDHKNLNELFSFNPTAENIATWIATEINRVINEKGFTGECYMVEVQESEGNIAIWEK